MNIPTPEPAEIDFDLLAALMGVRWVELDVEPDADDDLW